MRSGLKRNLNPLLAWALLLAAIAAVVIFYLTVGENYGSTAHRLTKHEIEWGNRVMKEWEKSGPQIGAFRKPGEPQPFTDQSKTKRTAAWEAWNAAQEKAEQGGK